MTEARTQDERTHDLKVWPMFFDALVTGAKPFEIRRNDRGYRAGDTLHLREWSPAGQGSYTGRELMCEVTYVTDWEQQPEWVVLGLGFDRWRPIATCPKDASYLLADEPVALTYIGYWNSTHASWFDQCGHPREPTHWKKRPLPPGYTS